MRAAAAAPPVCRDAVVPSYGRHDSPSPNPPSTNTESPFNRVDDSRPSLLSSRLNVSTTSLCGKRSRSNSSSSSTDYSSDGATSGFSASPSHYSGYVDSPATSVSSQSSPEEEKERSCPSPSAAKRKTVRCALQDTACTAPSAQHLGGASSSSTSGISSSTHPSYSHNNKSDADVAGLGGAVQAFGLNSREQTPEEVDPVATSRSVGYVEPSLSAAAAAKGNLRDHFVGESSIAMSCLPKSTSGCVYAESAARLPIVVHTERLCLHSPVDHLAYAPARRTLCLDLRDFCHPLLELLQTPPLPP